MLIGGEVTFELTPEVTHVVCSVSITQDLLAQVVPLDFLSVRFKHGVVVFVPSIYYSTVALLLFCCNFRCKLVITTLRYATKATHIATSTCFVVAQVFDHWIRKA